MTRDCIDPWNNAYISADGTVKPCCVMWEGIGKIGPDQSLKDIIDGPVLREYRESILTGELKGSCRDCHSRGWTTPEAMASKVRAYIEEAVPEVDAPSLALTSPNVSDHEDYASDGIATGIYSDHRFRNAVLAMHHKCFFDVKRQSYCRVMV